MDVNRTRSDFDCMVTLYQNKRFNEQERRKQLHWRLNEGETTNRNKGGKKRKVNFTEKGTRTHALLRCRKNK